MRADRGTRIYPVLLGRQRIGQAVTTEEAKEIIANWAVSGYGYLFYEETMTREKMRDIRKRCLEKLAEDMFKKRHLEWSFVVEVIKEAYNGQGIEALRLIG